MKELSERDKALRVDSIPEANLVAYYPALHGRGATLYDRSKNANNGAIGATVTWARLPSGLWALYFNGANKVVVPNTASIGGTALTVILWAKAYADLTQYCLISQRQSGVGHQWQLYFLDSDNTLFFSKWTSAAETYAISTAALSAINVWNQVGVTYDGANVRFYVNGVQLGNAVALTGAIDNVPTVTNIGSTQAAGDLKGWLGVVRFYNRVLSVTEILRHYTRERHLFGV